MAGWLSIPQNLWSLTDEDLRVAVFAGSLGDLNVSSLLKSYLDLLHECHVHDDFYEPKPRALWCLDTWFRHAPHSIGQL